MAVKSEVESNLQHAMAQMVVDLVTETFRTRSVDPATELKLFKARSKMIAKIVIEQNETGVQKGD